jgi:hypothetical protein
VKPGNALPTGSEFSECHPGLFLSAIALHFLKMFVAPALIGLRLRQSCRAPRASIRPLCFKVAKMGEHAASWYVDSINESQLTVNTQQFAI